MQLQQLRYFIEVAQTGSISTAAKNLYLSQPSLSQQIINLEKELGISLLIRHSRSVSLSDAGEQFLVHARRIVGETEQLSELMQKHSLLQTGTLHIGMLWIANHLNLLDILSDYKKIYTGLQYELTIDGSLSLLEKLSMRKLHAAFIIGNEHALAQQKDLFFRKIQEEHYVAVVPAESPLAGRESLSVQELRDVPLILPDKKSALYQHLQQYFDQYYIKPNCICHTSRTDVVISLVSHGFGVGFSSYSIARKFSSENFRIIALEEGLKRTIFYATLTELLDYPSIRTFTRYVTHYQHRGREGRR
jgi:DNA-binding transcriptional LysR family regulator